MDRALSINEIEMRPGRTAIKEAHSYLWPALRAVIAGREWPDRRAFDLGCGLGATAAMLAEAGFDTVGVDISASGIARARTAYPGVRFETGSAYDDLAARFGTFPLVVSLEVIEHCPNPRAMLRTFAALIAPGGVGFLSTPYHSYLKNLTIALAGECDSHYDPLRDGGHVKFFSIATLTRLMTELGLPPAQFLRVGRIPPLAKSMVAVVRT